MAVSTSDKFRGVRAAAASAKAALAARVLPDPAPECERDGVGAGCWPGHPSDRLPPGCPVVPLGKDGDLTYFIDTLGQLRIVNAHKWGKKILMDLFAEVPNFVIWAWPRFGKSDKNGVHPISGVDVDAATACLLKAAAARGLFSPQDRVRGRGAWLHPLTGELVWHSGAQLWMIEGGQLVVRDPGEMAGLFYPRRPPVLEPWRESVGESDDANGTPAHALLRAFRTWKWERPALDPLLLLGWLGAALLGGALDWRPPVFITGDRGQGKSTLQGLVKAILGNALHASADTTPAGIYQRVKQDCLPVAVDELEADADNRRAIGVIKLARLAASGSVMYRGGAEHEGVEFQARNCFAFSSINPPPLGSQDKSRIVLLQLRKIDQGGRAPELPGAIDSYGSRLLRQLMDGWAPGRGRPGWVATLRAWKESMREVGLDGRVQDTYGTLLAAANLLLGDEAMEEAGMPVTEPRRLGEMLADLTAAERAEQTDNWRSCLEHLLGSTIEAWKGGEKPTIGAILAELEAGKIPADTPHTVQGDYAGRALAAAGLGLVPRSRLAHPRRPPPARGAPGPRPEKPDREEWLLAVPNSSPLVLRLFAGTVWSGGVWTHALKQAPAEIVRRDWKPGVVKINRVAARCVLVDLQAYDRATEPEKDEDDDG